MREKHETKGKNFDGLRVEIRKMSDEDRISYGNVALQRWVNPPHLGSLENPDGHAFLRGRCGDGMEIFLRFEEDRVKDARFQTDGCRSSAVCGSSAAELALGKSPDELLEVTGEAVLEILGPFPEKETHCAFLAAEALQEALHDYMMKQKTKRQGGLKT